MTPRTPIQVVWFKRDLRVRDHAPLAGACASGPVLALFCWEPSQLAEPDVDARHVGFARESLADLQADLARLGVPLLIWHGEVVAALTALRARGELAGLWSHQETGNLASYARDRAVAAWCRHHGTAWTQLRQTGVVRCLPDRDGWAAQWEAFMRAPPASLPQRVQPAPAAHWQGLPASGDPWPIMARPDITSRQHGGRRAAVAALADFLGERAVQYRGGISSPLKAPTACSRLSPYLAWGNVSMREVVQATRRREAAIKALPQAGRPANLLPSPANFQRRLHWHCHFIQKLESEPEIEVRGINPAYIGLREAAFDAGKFAAWRDAETGYPLIDAAMVMLRETGWINFRLRAMLMSFAAYNLWLHWREPGLHLARSFTDYEPGIHWPQVQMQSGVTGINALRIYNPVKQAMDHDPQGHFVRRWLPAMRRVPDTWLFEPWRMSADTQTRCGVQIDRDYPAPVVDFTASMRWAKQQFAQWRQQPQLREQSRLVYLKHGSRASRDEREARPRKPVPSAQLALFGEDD